MGDIIVTLKDELNGLAETVIPEKDNQPARYAQRRWWSNKTPADGDVLTWDSTYKRWVPTASGVGTIEVYEGGVLVGETSGGITSIEVYEGGVLVGSTP